MHISDWNSDVCSSDLRRRTYRADALFRRDQTLGGHAISAQDRKPRSVRQILPLPSPSLSFSECPERSDRFGPPAAFGRILVSDDRTEGRLTWQNRKSAAIARSASPRQQNPKHSLPLPPKRRLR